MAEAGMTKMIAQMTDEEFTRYVNGIIRREFGMDGLVRFLRRSRAGSGDYTRDRHQWLDGLTVEEAMREL